ncbi:zinc-finger homeodomain protein 11-like [Typha latifolia]|uniref:zinc-finger homeodomain protein 11-like n=1 Tax=Typha latifolia TaxID=4733 RepID=UPI003C2EEC84
MEAERQREVYKECMRNHAAKLGTYAADGCCEYTPDAAAAAGALNCAACGCHRNFHRKAYVDYFAAAASVEEGTEGRRRTRTKFTEEQKASMAGFAERIGWRLPAKRDDDEVASFCREIGVSRQVFKVWMHNHKNGTSSSTTTTTLPNSSSTSQTYAEIDEEAKEESM